MDKILKSLEIYLDDNRATQTEIERFILFIQKLKSSRRVRFIYRGDSNIIEHRICIQKIRHTLHSTI